MFIEWMQECHEITDGEIIAIDGKDQKQCSFPIKGKRKRSNPYGECILERKWCLQLGQVKTEAKSNEITAIPELVNLLYLKKNLITIDAMGCQKDIASKDQSIKKQIIFWQKKAIRGNYIMHSREKFPVNVFSNYKGDSFGTQEISHGRKKENTFAYCQ